MSIAFNNVRNVSNNLCFLDKNRMPGINRLDTVKHKPIQDINEKMLEFFWRPEEISLTSVNSDWKKLSDEHRTIFVEMLKRAILLDSIQGRSVTNTLLELSTSSEVEFGLNIVSFFENIHSYSYSYIVRQLFSDPSIIFEEINDSVELIKCSDQLSQIYDDLYNIKNKENYCPFEHKKLLVKTLFSINMLESIRFFSAFAVFFSFAENSLMIPIAMIFKLIARDEVCHIKFFEDLISESRKEDPEFERALLEIRPELVKILNRVVREELEWVEHVFSDGKNLLGLNAEILSTYIQHRGTLRAKKYGIQKHELDFEYILENNLNWINKKYLPESNSKNVSSPQEIENVNYGLGILIDDMQDIQNNGLNDVVGSF